MQKSFELSSIHLDTQVEIFSYFTPKDFLSLSCTSKSFYKLFQNGEFWKAYTNKLGSKSSIYPTNLQVPQNDFYTFFKSAVKAFYLNTGAQTQGDLITLIPVEATSTDFSQSIEKVLITEKLTFWSSTGSNNPNNVDSLLFLFDRFMIVPFSVNVTFFTAEGFYEEGTLEFHSQYIQVLFSFDGLDWEFGSEEIPVNGQHSVNIKILGRVGIARYMKVNFIGKTVKQPTDDLYYVAVESVKCHGYKVDKNDHKNTELNELLIKSWVEWKNLQQSKTMKIETEYLSEITEYYQLQAFPKKIYNEFKALLESKNDEEIWLYLDNHKQLLLSETVYADIAKIYDRFCFYYLNKVINEKKRKMLNENETLLFFILYLRHHNNNGQFEDMLQVLNHHYHKEEILEIKYFQISTNVMRKLLQETGIGHEVAINYLKNTKHILTDDPTDYDSQFASIILFNYVIISNLVPQGNS